MTRCCCCQHRRGLQAGTWKSWRPSASVRWSARDIPAGCACVEHRLRVCWTNRCCTPHHDPKRGQTGCAACSWSRRESLMGQNFRICIICWRRRLPAWVWRSPPHRWSLTSWQTAACWHRGASSQRRAAGFWPPDNAAAIHGRPHWDSGCALNWQEAEADAARRRKG